MSLANVRPPLSKWIQATESQYHSCRRAAASRPCWPPQARLEFALAASEATAKPLPHRSKNALRDRLSKDFSFFEPAAYSKCGPEASLAKMAAKLS